MEVAVRPGNDWKSKEKKQQMLAARNFWWETRLASPERAAKTDALDSPPSSTAPPGQRPSSIHCPLHHPPTPALRRPLRHVCLENRLPGRIARCPTPCTAPRARCPGLRIIPVPVRRGKGRQVCQQGLRWPDYDSRAGFEGWHEIPAAARVDGRSREIRIPGTQLSIRGAARKLR